MKMEKEMLLSLPVWIRLPELCLHAWTTEAISRVVSLIGTPIKMDRLTASGGRLAFARCCVEVSAEDTLPQEVCIDMHGHGIWKQPVVYEWMPPWCEACKVFGHRLQDCQRKEIPAPEMPPPAAGPAASAMPGAARAAQAPPSPAVPLVVATPSPGSQDPIALAPARTHPSAEGAQQSAFQIFPHAAPGGLGLYLGRGFRKAM